jgi:hypothetical protein
MAASMIASARRYDFAAGASPIGIAWSASFTGRESRSATE